MGDRGLHTSRWAYGRSGDTHDFRGQGDWICPSCSFSNFQRRTECYRCSFKVGSDVDMLDNKQYAPPKETLPAVDSCHQPDSGDNYSTTQSDVRANGGGGEIGSSTYPAYSMKSHSHGLITSRWAPRKLNITSKTPDDSEIWTRVTVSPTKATSNSQEPKLSSPTSPTVQDLGLPYEVQHYILSLIQRILEEACYDFASRWIPATLSSHNWSCAEAVELSSWRRVLPSEPLPANALVMSTQKCSLDDALADAVKIRNAAVHRHLCSTTEIRRMAAKAEDLMAMFADRTRQNKFQRLGDELKEWDRGGTGYDEQVSRKRLHDALQEIGERPMDDMDWTPNEVSLREITDEKESLGGREEAYWDEMELD